MLVLFDPYIGSYKVLPRKSGPNTNGNEGVLHIPQSSKSGSSPSDCFVSYPVHSLGVSYPSEKYSQYILWPQPTELKIQWIDRSALT